MTLREALTRAASQLSAHPDLQPTAVPDATLLLMYALSLDRAALIAHPETILTRDQQAVIQRLVERRLRFEPLQYITGTQEFYGLALRVTPAVLIPRPETEQLVEAVLSHIKAQSVPHSSPASGDEWVQPTLRILDVGTGSGAIAIALAHALPHAHVTALDLSPEALAIAEENAATHGLHNRKVILSGEGPAPGTLGVEGPATPFTHPNLIRFLPSDLLAAVSHDPPYDIIVSNPPYIPATETLHPQVRDHEPSQALFAGPDGLDIYRRLIPRAHALLVPDGLLALEIGHGQRDAIALLLAAWHEVEFLPDLQGIPRIVLARPRPVLNLSSLE